MANLQANCAAIGLNGRLAGRGVLAIADDGIEAFGLTADLEASYDIPEPVRS